MSASPMQRQATLGSQAIQIRRVTYDDASQLPSRYSSTPGGSIYSTTPGGTRIIYEKSVLMNLRNSPCAKSPPTFCNIPEGLTKGSPKNTTANKKTDHRAHVKNHISKPPMAPIKQQNEDLFELDL